MRLPRSPSTVCFRAQRENSQRTGSISDMYILDAEGHKNGTSSGRNCILSDNIEKNAREPLKCLYNVQKSLPTGVGKAEEMRGCAYRLRHRYGTHNSHRI